MNRRDENLLIHLGGLGDVCLSEASFLTIARHYEKGVRAVGSKRVLEQFGAYFTRVDSIDTREWTHLFSDSPGSPQWKRIIFFGKDRKGAFRERLGRLADEVIFVDLFPDQDGTPVEQHQLAQLAAYGMEPAHLPVSGRRTDSVILYPEAGFQKWKWPPHRFVEIFERLKRQEIDVILMTPPSLDLAVAGTVSFEDLDDVATFFTKGGVFFSNDSGLAHFAARCGLRPLTLFRDADPATWRPRGSRVLRCRGAGPTVQEVADFILSEMGSMKAGE